MKINKITEVPFRKSRKSVQYWKEIEDYCFHELLSPRKKYCPRKEYNSYRENPKFTLEIIFYNILKKHNSNVFEVVRDILHITSYKNLRSPLLCQNKPPPAKKPPLKNRQHGCFTKHSNKASGENSNKILVVKVFERKTSKGPARFNLIKKGLWKVHAYPPPAPPTTGPLIGIFSLEKTWKNDFNPPS